MISNNKYLTQGEMESNAKEIYTYLSDKGWTINSNLRPAWKYAERINH